MKNLLHINMIHTSSTSKVINIITLNVECGKVADMDKGILIYMFKNIKYIQLFTY